ncbi:SemiSWEET family sugar transporter [Thermodesulfobium acidiphilum]|uniref:SemiSWEET family sugar transporter n=1 Tax=Thermodesulfobium acidiphilum TaxID=1794699 RepID=UPI000D38DDC5|nr:SemiSWEET transporter [Thermodesulfobium acidiphilum]
MFETYLGLFAGLLTTSSLVPQVVKAWKTRSTNDISLIMLIMMWIGVFCWVIYGLSIFQMPIVLWNFISFVLLSILLYFKKNSKNSC